MADYQESILLFGSGVSRTAYCQSAVEGARFLMVVAATSDGLATVAQNDGITAPVYAVGLLK